METENLLEKMNELSSLFNIYTEFLSKAFRTYEHSTKRLNKLNQEIINQMQAFINNTNERLEGYEKELQLVKSRIILSEENANRAGRHSLTDVQINQIKELINDGLSQRKVAEITDLSLGTVNKYANLDIPLDKVTEFSNETLAREAQEKETAKKARAEKIAKKALAEM